MKIIADENIPLVRDIFSRFGKVYCYPGRNMNQALLADADALLVRSITKVNAELLDKTSIRFVGTATIGTDHIDQDYLKKNKIFFTSAAGCNANSVAEYVMTALLLIAQRYHIDLQGMTLGIIGVGNIGSIVDRIAPALGLKTLRNDPPLQRSSGRTDFVSLDELISRSDIITCHTPLTRTGQDPTFHLIDQKRISQLKPKTILINASRGPVVDNLALKAALQDDANTLGPVVLDVWENEPAVDADLLALTDIATPHIAGYSFEGKINGTTTLYRKLCQFLDTTCDLDIADLLPKPYLPELYLDNRDQSHQNMLYQAMTAIYDLVSDDNNLRQTMDLPADNRPVAFDQLRKSYSVRREAANTRIFLTQSDPNLQQKLALLGFQVSS